MSEQDDLTGTLWRKRKPYRNSPLRRVVRRHTDNPELWIIVAQHEGGRVGKYGETYHRQALERYFERVPEPPAP